jgi:mannosyltransferase OCH1-like enzyme
VLDTEGTMLVPTFNGIPIVANSSLPDASTSVSAAPVERARGELTEEETRRIRERPTSSAHACGSPCTGSASPRTERRRLYSPAAMVPKVLHQIWLGEKPLPDEFARYRQTWLDHHPSWEHHLWTEDNLPTDLRRPEARERLRLPAERSDILRLEVLWRHGGVYVDTDFECHKPLDPLIEGLDFFTAKLKPHTWVNNAFLGATAQHPIVDRALREIRPNEWPRVDKHGTGPRFLDTLLQDHLDEITLLPPELFYQTSPSQLPDAYATHHAAASWRDAAGERKAARLAEERNFELRGRIEELEHELAATRKKLASVQAKLDGRRLPFLRG